MKLQLPIQIQMKPSFDKVVYKDHILLLGSCFSEHIGHQLAESKFDITNNPFGILYNPKSIAHSLSQIIDNKKYEAKDLLLHNDLWLSLDHHGSFSNQDQNIALNKINAAIKKAHENLLVTRTIIITFGSSFFYELKEQKRLVGNCHKLPNSHFTRSRMNIEEIVTSYRAIIERIQAVNSDIQVLFTVSPIRHWKDGAVGNNWSKAILICAVQELVSQFNHVHYFPSYELLMDELRDYRFYREDMLHPSEQAIKYIWSRFVESCMKTETKLLMNKVAEIKQACTHRPFNFESQQHQRFIAKTKEKIELVQKENPTISFHAELAQLIES